MSGANDNRANVYDWKPQDPSSISILSSSLNEEFDSRPYSGFLAENENTGSWKYENQNIGVCSKIVEDEVEINLSNDIKLQPRSFGSSPHGGLSESMCVRKGFNLPKIDTTRVPLANMASSPDICSPYVTIPPDLSPTMLLDSPVFLYNSVVQTSPTTGKLQFAGNSSSKSIMVSVSAAPNKIECELFEEFSEAFAFYPPLEPRSHLPCAGQRDVNQQQELPGVEVSAQPRKPTHAESIEVGNNNFQNQETVHLHACFSVRADRNDAADNTTFNQRTSVSLMVGDHSLAVDDQQDGEGDPKELSAALDAPAEDEYNWRKYGQKQVKGSEYPRNYYKCTRPNCQAKKKVERSHEGHITEIIYKGSHNHLQPHPNRRPVVSSSRPFSDPQIDGSDQPSLQTNFEDKSHRGSSHNGNGSQDLWGDRLEAISYAPVAAECGDASNTLQRNRDGTHLSPEPIGVSSTMSNDEEEDDGATHGSVSLGGDGEDNETESRRRKLDASAMEMNAASRAVREPRVVVQTISEVDILDDGYRWRKYGQKVVKGNPNPRSYYKCTNPGCTVRKHIERASHDLKSVITTYEGRHNHQVPAARSNGGHPNTALSSTTANSAPQPSGLVQRPEPPTQESFRRFERPATLRAYGFPGRDHLGLPLPATTSFPFAMGQPGGLTNLAMHVAGLGSMAAAMKLPVIPPINPYVVHHHRKAAGFMMPKAEPKKEANSESQLHMRNAHQRRMMMDGHH